LLESGLRADRAVVRRMCRGRRAAPPHDAKLSITLPEVARRRGWRATCGAIVWTAAPAALTAVGRAGTVHACV